MDGDGVTNLEKTLMAQQHEMLSSDDEERQYDEDFRCASSGSGTATPPLAAVAVVSNSKRPVPDEDALMLSHQQELLEESLSSADEDAICPASPMNGVTNSSKKDGEQKEPITRASVLHVDDEALAAHQRELLTESISSADEDFRCRSLSPQRIILKPINSVNNGSNKELVVEPETKEAVKSVEKETDNKQSGDDQGTEEEPNRLLIKNGSDNEFEDEPEINEDEPEINEDEPEIKNDQISNDADPSSNDEFNKLLAAGLPNTLLAKIQPATSNHVPAISEHAEGETPHHQTTYCYDRDQIMAVQKSRTDDEWIAYLWCNHGQEERPTAEKGHISTGAWPINDMPFELDPEMRCPFPQQLRVQREREAERRRWFAAGKHHQVVPSSTTTTTKTQTAWGDPNTAVSGCDWKHDSSNSEKPPCIYAVSASAPQQKTDGKNVEGSHTSNQSTSSIKSGHKGDNKKLSNKQLLRNKQIAEEKQRMAEISQKILDNIKSADQKLKQEREKEKLMAKIKKEQKRNDGDAKMESEKDWTKIHMETMAMAKNAILEGENERRKLLKKQANEEKHRNNRVADVDWTDSEIDDEEQFVGHQTRGKSKQQKQKKISGPVRKQPEVSSFTFSTSNTNRWTEQYLENKTSSSGDSDSDDVAWKSAEEEHGQKKKQQEYAPLFAKQKPLVESVEQEQKELSNANLLVERPEQFLEPVDLNSITFFTSSSWEHYLEATNKWIREWNLSRDGNGIH